MGDITPPFIRSPYNYDLAEASRQTGLECLDPSLTVQSDAEDADINVIVRRFGVTGEWPQTAKLPQYGDFTEIVDFQTAQQAIRAAQEGFNALPAEVRAFYNNDPQALLEASAHDGFEAEFQARFGAPPPAPTTGDTPVEPLPT